MIKLKIEPHDSALLRQQALPFDFKETPYDAPELAYAMSKFMVDHGGYGLAAPQVGVGYRVFVIRGTPNYALFNPRIVNVSGGEVEAIEGCLTFPGMGISVKRHRIVRLRFQMPNGETETKNFHGLSARVIQHEIDHLDGVLMFDRATGLNKKFALKKWAKVVKEGRHVPRPLTVAEAAESSFNVMRTIQSGVDLEQLAEKATIKS